MTPHLMDSSATAEQKENYYKQYQTVRANFELSVSGFYAGSGDVFFNNHIGVGNTRDVNWQKSLDYYEIKTDSSSKSANNGDFLNEYIAYNYMKITTGDYDGDGLDEIAVYVPEMQAGSYDSNSTRVNNVSHARVEVYDRQGDTVNFAFWELATSIPLALYGEDGVAYSDAGHWTVLPNMVSLNSGDFNKDGIDDLAISYGYVGYDYYIPSSVTDGRSTYWSTEHRASIRWGATYDENEGSYMLADSYDFPLTTNSGDRVVRAVFTTGDADGDGYDELVLGGSVLGESTDTRYLAVYKWNGRSLSKTLEQSFDIFEKHEGTNDRVYDYIEDENTYYSRVNMPANIAVGNFFGETGSPGIYLDSLLIGYDEGGDLTILDMVKNNSLHLNNTTTNYYYAEYGARAEDINGSGTDVLVTRAHYFSQNKPASGEVEEVIRGTGSLNQNRDYWTSTAVLLFSKDSTAEEPKNVYGAETLKYIQSNGAEHTPLCFSLPNLDRNDSIVLEYTGEHYYTYADPEILAVLASPPHFKDLEAVADNSMMESSTSYATSSGSASGSSHSHGFSAGVYASYEQDVSIFGVKLFSYEMETSINNSFTWEFQQMKGVEYEVSYNTQVGQDSVVLYAMPVETYVYTAHIPGSEDQTLNVNIPYEPSVEVISLEKYNRVYEQYSDVLPEIDGTVLTHTVGIPSTYPSSESQLPSGKQSILTYPGNAMSIGYGSGATSQSIEMTSESEKSFNWEIEISFKAGAGGGLVTGASVGTTHGAGTVSVTTSGSAYSAEMQALPSIAEEYGYGFNWRMTSFLYEGKYPVVTYLVTSVRQPPMLPQNFAANDELTTSDTLALEWDYAGAAVGFNLYRYYTTTAGSDYYLIDTVSLNEFASSNEDGSYHFIYKDENLSPGTEYRYKIQTIGSGQPNLSAQSDELVTYTKPANSPVLSVTAQTLQAWPDTSVASSVVVENADELGNAVLHYQWEKMNDKGNWATVTLKKDSTLSIQYGNEEDAGIYRCRVTAMMDAGAVTVYSPTVTVNFNRRTAAFQSVVADAKAGTVSATLAGTDTNSIPSGNVVFTLDGAAGETSYTAPIVNGTATIDDIGLQAGVYAVSCYYSGDRVFFPVSYNPEEPVFFVKGAGTDGMKYLSIKDTYTYGEKLDFTLYNVDSEGKVTDSQILDLNGVTLYRNRFEGEDSYSTFGNGRFGWQGTSATEVHNRFRGNRAGWVGDYRFSYNISDGKGSRYYYFDVTPSDAAVTGLDTAYAYQQTNLRQVDLNALQSNLTFTGLMDFSDVNGGSDEAILKNRTGNNLNHRDLVVIDRDGKEYRTVTDLSVGVYTLGFSPSYMDGAGSTTYWTYTYLGDNYNIDWPAAQFLVTGPVYNVNATTNSATWGKVTVVSPANATTVTAGQTVIFRAEPYVGYEVECWRVDGTDYGNAGVNTFSHTVT